MILEYCKIRDDQMGGFHGIKYSEDELNLCNSIRSLQNAQRLHAKHRKVMI